MIDAALILKGAFVAVLLLAAYSDLRRLLIPNVYPAIMIVLFVIATLLGFPFTGPLWSHLLHFAVALSVGLGLFYIRWFGGGDVKLYAAIALWFGLSQAWFLLLVTALSGVAVVLFRLLVHFVRVLLPSGRASAGGIRKSDRRIPYGIAIAAGGIISLFFHYS